jgi:hypothetical protein
VLHTLISFSALTQKENNVIFKVNDCFIYDKPPSKMLIARVNMENNRIYPKTIYLDYSVGKLVWTVG